MDGCRALPSCTLRNMRGNHNDIMPQCRKRAGQIQDMALDTPGVFHIVRTQLSNFQLAPSSKSHAHCWELIVVKGRVSRQSRQGQRGEVWTVLQRKDRADSVNVMALEIPKILHQTWRTVDLPPPYAEWRAGWIANHPGWTYRLYDDAAMRRIITSRAPQWLSTFDALPQMIQRVNFFRYLGVYLDEECMPISI